MPTSAFRHFSNCGSFFVRQSFPPKSQPRKFGHADLSDEAKEAIKKKKRAAKKTSGKKKKKKEESGSDWSDDEGEAKKVSDNFLILTMIYNHLTMIIVLFIS